MMTKKWSLKTKLLGLCILLSLVSALVGLTSYIGTSRVADSYERVSDVALPKLKHLNNMFLYFRDLRINVRTLGLTDLTQEESDKLISNAKTIIQQYEEETKLYLQTDFINGEKELYSKLDAEWSQFKTMGGKLLSAYNNDEAETVRRIILVDCPESADRFTTAINNLKEFQDRTSLNFVGHAKNQTKTMNLLIITIIIVGVVLGLTVGIFFSKSIVSKFMSITDDLISSSQETSTASGDLSDSSNLLSQNSTESASSLQQTVASLEQLSAMVRLNSDHAKEANNLSQLSLKSAEEGKDEITHLIASMEKMNASSKKIEEIINVIDDIAFQTNLLALNAAVEAARAGEQGKGFAVVADAVRNLAGRSAHAAKDINQLIKENVQRSNESSAIANSSGEVLHQIVRSVEKVATLNLEIASASKEQSFGLTQISQAMNQLESATKSNVETSHNVASFAERMSHQSQSLVGLADELNVLIKAKDKKAA